MNKFDTLPKITFNDEDHTKVKRAMLMYDPMKDIIKRAWKLHFDGMSLNGKSPEMVALIHEIKNIQDYLK
jgi:hypothetical protein